MQTLTADSFLSSPQLHINVTAPTRERMESVKQQARILTPRGPGGLWTSTPRVDKDSDLVLTFAALDHSINPSSVADDRVWQQGREGMCYSCWHLYPEKRARVAIIESRDGLKRMAELYGTVSYLSFISILPVRGTRCCSVDYAAMAKDYDAIHVTARAKEELRLEPARVGLDGWISDTTWWLRWRFSKIEYAGTLLNYLKMPLDQFRWALKEPTREEKQALLTECEAAESEFAAAREKTHDALKALLGSGPKSRPRKKVA